jgi:uncharacterized protein YceH (UPF0502 family)
MPEPLTDIEARIVGALVEKQLTTPEYYPLTMNALVNACNQKNNREPVMALDEPTVSKAIQSLRDRNLVYVFHGSTSRVPKYKHMLPSYYELDAGEVAIMTVMMLRGPQTVGELRERTGRMHEFADLGEVHTALDGLIAREEPLVVKLDHLPGRKEPRYAHLLSGELDVEEIQAIAAATPASVSLAGDRISKLEGEIAALREEMNALREEFATFREQFE